MSIILAGLLFSFIAGGQPTSGIVKYGFIGHAVTDSTNYDPRVADYFISSIAASSVYELYFSPKTSLTIQKIGEAVKKTLLDVDAEIIIHIFEHAEVKLYRVDSFGLMLDELRDSLEVSSFSFKDSMEQLFKVSTLPEDQKEIFGFPCNKVTIMSPDDPTQPFSIAYCTKVIPMAEILGPIGEFMPGTALESTIFINGISLTMGATAFTPTEFQDPYFGIKLETFTKVSQEEFEMELQKF